MTFARAALIAFALVAAASSATGQPVDGHLCPPERIVDRVHVMRQPDRLWAVVIGNVTIIEQRRGIVLIDTGGTPRDGRDIVAAVRRLTRKPIIAVVFTHWHNDHPLGARAILAAWPRARIIATDATRRGMIERMGRNTGIGRPEPALDTRRLNLTFDDIRTFEANARSDRLTPSERAHYATEARYARARVGEQMGNFMILPNTIVADRLLLPDAEAPVEIRFLGRANTNGDLIAWLPRQRVVVTGDIVVAPIPYGFNSFVTDWTATLDRIRALDFAVLIPGHGAPQRDRAYLDRLQTSLRRVQERVAPLAAQGLPVEEVQRRIDYADEIAAFGGADPWTARWLRNYWLNPITVSAWRQATGAPIPAPIP